jgi:hypothetical protein
VPEVSEPETVCQLVVGERETVSVDVDLPLQEVVRPGIVVVVVGMIVVVVVVVLVVVEVVVVLVDVVVVGEGPKLKEPETIVVPVSHKPVPGGPPSRRAAAQAETVFP